VKSSIKTYGPFFYTQVKFPVLLKKDDYVVENSFKNLKCDKLHIKALKYILGVHKNSANDAILGETGRYPLYINIITQSTKYCFQNKVH
jgi:hypothetical protein